MKKISKKPKENYLFLEFGYFRIFGQKPMSESDLKNMSKNNFFKMILKKHNKHRNFNIFGYMDK